MTPTLRAGLRGSDDGPGSSSFVAPLHDAHVGPVRITGLYDRAPGASALLVVVHGLGGSVASTYMARPCRVALDNGVSCLRLNLRGADRGGDDVYHAGLTADLAAALASPLLSAYRDIFLLGFSMGGHTVLRWALEPTEPRVRAVASVCTPLNLTLSCALMDRPRKWLYRRHVLTGLKAIHAGTAARGRALIPATQTAAIRTLREWDARVVAPRFGFDSAEHYWEATSVGPVLHRVQLPALLLATTHDPMVPPSVLKASLDGLRAPSEARWVKGGHLGYPADVRVEESALAFMQRFAST